MKELKFQQKAVRKLVDETIYEKKLQVRQKTAKERAFEQYTWEVPAERLYKESTHHVMPQMEEHALLPFIELNTASSPECRFSEYLEANKEYIDWWYKNGDEGKQHYSILRGRKILILCGFRCEDEKWEGVPF